MTHPPGRVATATVRGVSNVRVFRYSPAGTDRWITASRIEGHITHGDDDVTDVRPLIVLDLAAVTDADRMAGHLMTCPDCRNEERQGRAGWCRKVADQIRAQTRPVIEEPMGLAAAVLTAEGRTFIRTARPNFPWVDAAHPAENAWRWNSRDGLDRCTPTEVLSPGVAS